jgi:hypothetical protein
VYKTEVKVLSSDKGLPPAFARFPQQEMMLRDSLTDTLIRCVFYFFLVFSLSLKQLSSCQKSCKFVPRKSTRTTIERTGGPPLDARELSTPRRKKNGLPEETNKTEKEEDYYGEGDEINKNPTLRQNTTSASSPPLLPILPVKREDSVLQITRSDTTGVFHLHWPKMASSLSSPDPSSPTLTSFSEMPIIVYTVLVDLSRGNHRWKLIDQTVATQTQISLVAEVCQSLLDEPSPLPKALLPTQFRENSFSYGHPRNHELDRSNIEIRVMAVNAQGLVEEKLFTAQVSCSCPVDRAGVAKAKEDDEEDQKNKFVSPGNEIRDVEGASSESYGFVDENSNQISTSKSNTFKENRTKKVEKELNKASKAEKSKKLVNSDKKKATNKSLSSFPSPSNIYSLSTASSWSLRMVSMVHQDSLVVTELSWKLPVGLSNQRNESPVTSKASPRDGFEDEGSNQKYNFLLTWEIFGGGLRGNLVTDTTSGSISLWPDTAYFIQVRINHSFAFSLLSLSWIV